MPARAFSDWRPIGAGTAPALLWANPGSALSPATACENAKLSAAGADVQCLIGALKQANARGQEELTADAIARCDPRLD
jgi:hypothetical protein